MILSGKEIINRQGKDIIIDPFDENQVNPNSYNLRLHNEGLLLESNKLYWEELLNTQKPIILFLC